MARRFVFALLFVLVVVAAVVGIGAMTYNAGLAQGLAQSGKLVSPEGGTPFYLYARPFLFWPFGLFGPLFLLLIGFLLFGFIARLLFRRSWGAWGRFGGPAHMDKWPEGVPSLFKEWHRRAHDEGQSQPTKHDNPQP